MPNKDYWIKRQEDLQNSLLKGAEDYTKEIEKGYLNAVKEIEKQIAVWYQRFADNNGVDLVTAQRLLNNNELAELKWDVNEYIKRGRENGVSADWSKELENASARVHISRLEALKMQIREQLEEFYGNRPKKVEELLGEIYTDSLLKNGYEHYLRTGVETAFISVDKDSLNRILAKPWTVDGKNFSDRIWDNKSKLIRTINTELTSAIAIGEAPSKTAERIAKTMKSDKSSAQRLVMTEGAYFATQGQQDCYKELDIEEYEIIGTLDSITCDECGGMDDKHFPLNKMEAGVTAPPFHPNCRCTTVPYFDDEFTEGEMRAARDEEGNTYYTDAKSYEEWKERFVKNDVDNSEGSGIINYARASDIFLYDEDDIPVNAEIKPDDIIKNLETSEIGKEILEYLEANKVYPQLTYEPQYHSNRGEQFGKIIILYMDNIINSRVAAQTLIHEATHQKYGIGGCQWAEAICMAKEKMHITGKNKLTADELRYIVELSKSAYPELKWKKGGYRNGKKF